MIIKNNYFELCKGIMLVYDVTNEKSFDNIRNWIRNIEEVSHFKKFAIDQTLPDYDILNVYTAEVRCPHCVCIHE